MRCHSALLLSFVSFLAASCDDGVVVTGATCSNQVADGTESDVDCGGTCPSACVDGKRCKETKDCASGACVDLTCTPPAVPVAITVEPWTGPLEGGTSVTITGTGFADAMTVRFGSVAATAVTLVSSTELSTTTPVGEAGPVGFAPRHHQ